MVDFHTNKRYKIDHFNNSHTVLAYEGIYVDMYNKKTIKTVYKNKTSVTNIQLWENMEQKIKAIDLLQIN